MAISRSKVIIYIVDADTVPSTLATTDQVCGQIINYSQTGGNTDIETVNAFCGDITKEQSREQVEVSLEVVPNLDSQANALFWEKKYLSTDTTVATTVGGTVYTLADSGTNTTTPGSQMIVIQADGTSHDKSIAFNNATLTQFEMDHNADDNQTLNITFKMSPTTTGGVSNVMVAQTTATSLPAFSAIDNN